MSKPNLLNANAIAGVIEYSFQYTPELALLAQWEYDAMKAEIERLRNVAIVCGKAIDIYTDVNDEVEEDDFLSLYRALDVFRDAKLV